MALTRINPQDITTVDVASTGVAPELSTQPAHESVERLRLVWSRRQFLFRLAICALVISTAIAFLIPNRYTSTAQLMPPDSTSSSALESVLVGLTGRGGGGAGIAGDLLGLKSTSDSFVGILSSRTVQDQLIEQFNLKKIYHVKRMEDARKVLEGYTSLEIDRKSQIVTIEVTDHDPKRAAAMGQAYIEQLNRLVAELSTSSARRERIFLEGRLQGVRKDLEAAENEFSKFASKNTAIDVPAQGKAMLEAAAVLQGQLIAAQSELEGLRQIYADNNVRVRSLTARVAELQDQLNKLGGKGVSNPGASTDSLYPSIRELPLLGVPYADLYRRTKVEETIFETLTQEYEVAKVQEAKEIPTVKVLDSPNVPDKKSFPPRLLIIFLGLLLGVAGGVSWVFGNATWRETDPSDPRKVFAQEVFGAVRAYLPQSSRNGHFLRGEDGPNGGE